MTVAGKPATSAEDEAAETRDAESPSAPRRRSRRRELVEWLIVIAVAVALSFVGRAYVAQTFFIPSCSMAPTLEQGDRVVVNKLAYDFHSVHRGDIIVFSRPAGLNVPDADLIKRVIGLPGDHVSQGPGNEVMINGKVLPQPWLSSSMLAGTSRPITPVTVPAGEYFVMGDNRGSSDDSRYWGFVPGKDIVGKADIRIWPLSRFGAITPRSNGNNCVVTPNGP